MNLVKNFLSICRNSTFLEYILPGHIVLLYLMWHCNMFANIIVAIKIYIPL